MRTQYFYADSYQTAPGKQKLSIFDRFRRSRFLFTASFLAIVFKTRRAALKGLYHDEEWAGSSIDIMRLLERAGARFTITGFDNIRRAKKPVVFICNHMSTLETMILPGLISPLIDVTFVVKDSLVSHPLFGPVMRSREPIVVSRKNSREDLLKVINEGSDLLDRGESIVIFPQSTRRENFDPASFNTLGIKLAARTNATVIPVALRTDFWKNGKIIKDLGPLNREAPVMLSFGEPFSIEGNGKEEQKRIIGFIAANLREWGCEVVD